MKELKNLNTGDLFVFKHKFAIMTVTGRTPEGGIFYRPVNLSDTIEVVAPGNVEVLPLPSSAFDGNIKTELKRYINAAYNYIKADLPGIDDDDLKKWATEALDGLDKALQTIDAL